MGMSMTMSTSTLIRLARQCDVDAIVDIETASFPQVYTNPDELARRRRDEIERGHNHPCSRIFVLATIAAVATDDHDQKPTPNENQSEIGATPIHGLVILESYLCSPREYSAPSSGPGSGSGTGKEREETPLQKLSLPANRPQDRKAANDILMAATRVDPGLLEEEFLCESSSFLYFLPFPFYESGCTINFT
jgi:hypothetical protein